MLLHRRESWRVSLRLSEERGVQACLQQGRKEQFWEEESNCCSERQQKKPSTVSRSARGGDKDASALEMSGLGQGGTQRRSVSLLSTISGHHHVVTTFSLLRAGEAFYSAG